MYRTLRVSILVLVVACAGCSTSSTSSQAAAPVTYEAAASCAAQVNARLTEPERVGQLFLVGTSDLSADSAALRAHHFGSVLLSGDSTAGVAAIRRETDAIQGLAVNGVGLFVGVNQEGGEVQQLKGPGFENIPSALAQGSLDPSTLRADAERWGRELKDAGVNLDLAPVLDVVPPGTASENAPIGMLDREFGFYPGTVGAHGVAFIRGLQAAGVAATAKHFPGLGRVRGNTDFTANVVDTATTDQDLATYQAGIDAGVPFVMVALATYTRIDPDHLAVFSPGIVTGLLRDRLHFTGVIISDDMGEAAAVASIAPGTRAIDFITAGGDMVTSQDVGPAVTMAEAVLRRAGNDAAFREAVTTAVLRILTAKAKYGLLACLRS
jgi:beta-N-acetylhexosaminidase